MAVSVDEMETFFRTYEGPNTMKLDQCTEILDIKKMADNHISALRGNPGNRAMLPYYNRLVRVYELLKQ